jgi:predicted alpha/beta-fold hydrolase
MRPYIIGFSLGGNLTLKFLGEQGSTITNMSVKKGIAISAPIHLHSACQTISQPNNWIYSRRFLKSLKKKIIKKAEQYPSLNTTNLHRIKSLIDFDDAFTAPIHGFKDALDYYTKNSSIYFLDTISIPTLLLNAENDPFLSKECFPDLSKHAYINFLKPSKGGHVGFSQFNKNGIYWSEERAIDFLLT